VRGDYHYEQLLDDYGFLESAKDSYQEKIAQLKERKKHEKNPYLKRRWSRELGKAEKALLLLSPQGSPGSREEVTDGRNCHGANPWRVLRVGFFLPLLGREVPRDLSPLKPVLVRGLWEGWKVSSGPPTGGRAGACEALLI